MKVLYISEGGKTCDYMRDMLFHGLRSLMGPDVVDVHKIETMYRGYPIETCYGKGFTIYGLLPDIPIDREDIREKILTHYFDLVIFGSIHRNRAYFKEVLTNYKPSEILAVDGEDHGDVVRSEAFVTLKRELYEPLPWVLPIQFAIPKEKILHSPPIKSHLMAPMDPANPSTYIYQTEKYYYAQYADSYYGATMKKAGWDCLRHYEILSQWCLPYFRNLESLPPLICQHLPRRVLRMVQLAWEPKPWPESFLRVVWEALMPRAMVALRDHMTTEALAKYVLQVKQQEIAA